jgi:hypothetical protein
MAVAGDLGRLYLAIALRDDGRHLDEEVRAAILRASEYLHDPLVRHSLVALVASVDVAASGDCVSIANDIVSPEDIERSRYGTEPDRG